MQGYGGYGPPSSGRHEQPIFAGGGVQVTTARLVCANQTYPIGAITSVAPFVIPADQSGPGCGLFAGIAGALGSFVMFAIGLAAESVSLLAMFGPLAVICIAVVVGCAYWRTTRKPSYGVSISTAGMQVRAVVSPDQAFTHAVIGALNQALSMR